MAQHQALRGTREAPIGDHRHRPAEPFADDRGRDLQHLAHPRPALRTFVPNDHRVAGLDPAGVDRGERILFAVEDTSGAAMGCGGVLRDLGHRAVGCEVALQYHDAPLGSERTRQRRDHLLLGGLRDVFALLAQRPAGHRERVPVDVAAFDQPLGEQRDASGTVQLDRGEPSTWL